MEDENYRPISPLGYVGYQFLFAIPVIGFICVIVFAITASNQNVKNFARAQIIVYIITMILVAIVGAATFVSGITLTEILNSASSSQTM